MAQDYVRSDFQTLRNGLIRIMQEYISYIASLQPQCVHKHK
jgi:hypothetical protein